jgi:exonuclease SbcC
MELDGISIDKFKNRLDAELEELTKRWDIKSMSIENKNRGINNPYKIGTGKIYDCYIEKGLLAEEIAEAKRNENLYRELSIKIKELQTEEKELKDKIVSLEEIEEDISRRYEIGIEVDRIAEKLEILNDAAEKWPELEAEVKKLSEQKKNLNDQLSELQTEKENAERYQQKVELEEKLKKIEEFEEKISDLAEQIENIGDITEDKISELEGYKEAVDKSEAGLKAGKLKAKINFSADESIKVTAGVEEEKEISSADIIEADGYIRIKTEHIDIEVESAEIDFSDLQKKYRVNKEKFNEVLEELKVDGLSAARDKLNRLKEMKNKKSQAEERISEILAGQKLEDLREKLTQFAELEEARELKIIEAEIDELNKEINAVQPKLAVKENDLNKLEKDYSSLLELKSLIEKKKKAKKELLKEVDDLAELPEAYADAAAFKRDLKETRDKKDKKAGLLREKLQELKSLENQLPDRSTREMEAEFEELEVEFERLVNRAQNLELIKETFLNKLKEMDQNSFQPLIETFSDNLNQLTDGKYRVGEIDDRFNVTLKNDQKKLPANLDLLSFGTYDGAALAFRFALFNNLFKEHGGFIILDDCLVNLDPERRKRAVELINELQNKYQIIYTTCSPKRAEELDGHIIEV